MNAPLKDLVDYFSEIDASSIAPLVAAAADLVLIVGRDGCVKDVVVGQNSDLGFTVSDLVGHKVQSLAPPDAKQELGDLIKTVDDIPRTCTLTHVTSHGHSNQIKYNVLSLGPNKDVIFLGQSQKQLMALKEQLQAAELISQKQSARKKQDAAEFQALFSINQHPILIVSAATGMVKDANMPALKMLDLDRAQLLGQRLENIFAKPRQKAMKALIDQAKAAEIETTATLSSSSQSVRVKSLQGVVGHDALIFQLTPQTEAAPIENLDQALIEIAKSSSDYVAIVDNTGQAVWSNNRLLSLTTEQADPAPNLKDYLNCDFLDLLEQANKLGRVSIATEMRGTAETMTPAELFVVSLHNTHPGLFGVTVTPAPNLNETQFAPKQWPTNKIGSVPLSALVREEVDIIEKSCIEAALKLTGNNRQATAKVLGISRQGLYDKFRRHNILMD